MSIPLNDNDHSMAMATTPPPCSKSAAPIDPDITIMARLGAGEPSALQDLMDLHMTALHRAAVSITQDKMAAEDAVQMAFLQIWKIAPNWQAGRGSARAYLYRVMTHRCLDMLRRRRESLPGDIADRADPGPDALEQLSQQDRARQINAAMAELPPRQRAALSLFYYEHLSLKDAARSLELSPAAFESLLRRARARLKPFLADLEPLS